MSVLPYHFESQGRSTATLLALLAVWSALIAGWVLLDAALFVVVPVALLTLPALHDLIFNPRAALTLDARSLRWHAGRQDGDIALSEIDHLRFDTRLDMSVRVTVVRPSGRKIRLPHPATPPHRQLEEAAREAGLKTQRHHFSLMG